MFIFPLLAVLLWAAPSLQVAPAMGPVGQIDIKKVQECRNFNGVLKLQLTKDSKQRKVFNAQLKIKEDYTNSFMFKVNVHKWTGTEYKKNMMKYEGKLCEYVNKFLKTVRANVYKLAKVTTDCVVKAGSYDVKGIHALESQLSVPAIPYGTFQLELQIYNGKKNMVACAIIDAESIPKKSL